MLDRVEAQVAGDVEANAARDHLVAHLMDGVLLGAAGGNQGGVVAVPHLVVIENMAEGVPLGAALQRQGHHIVGVADAAFVLGAGDGVGAGGEHGMDGIKAVAPKPGLRALIVEIEGEGKADAALYQFRRLDHIFGLNIIDSAILVVGSPLSPDFEAIGGFPQMIDGEHFFAVAAYHLCLLPRTAPTCQQAQT